MLQSRTIHSTIFIFIILASILIQFMTTFVYMDLMHLFSALVIPMIFIIIAGVFVRESIFFLIVPIILYFTDRVYIFLMNGLYAVDLIANDPTIGFAGASFYVINLFRIMFAIGLSVYAVVAISAKSEKGWAMTHRLMGILLVTHIIEFLFWNGYFIGSSIDLLYGPGAMYFPILMFSLTNPKWHQIDFENSFTSPPTGTPVTRSSSGTHPYPSHPGQSWQPSGHASAGGLNESPPQMPPNFNQSSAPNTVVCPNCQTRNRASDNFCLKCGTRIKSVTSPKPQPSSSATRQSASAQSVSAQILRVCPECNTENSSQSPYCLTCGHNLKQ